MTNGTKTVGGAIASAIFAIALTATGSLDATSEKVAPLSGYLTVWAVCSGAAFLAAPRAAAAPKHAFSDAPAPSSVIPADRGSLKLVRRCKGRQPQ